mmetsp:Transcript_24975/g.68868  ORF Transcript_24975/g.68868 Transcript_24975/m.68868 type:complete len:245 (-) Transcript_24975:148-882(-)
MQTSPQPHGVTGSMCFSIEIFHLGKVSAGSAPGHDTGHVSVGLVRILFVHGEVGHVVDALGGFFCESLGLLLGLFLGLEAFFLRLSGFSRRFDRGLFFLRLLASFGRRGRHPSGRGGSNGPVAPRRGSRLKGCCPAHRGRSELSAEGHDGRHFLQSRRHEKCYDERKTKLRGGEDRKRNLIHRDARFGCFADWIGRDRKDFWIGLDRSGSDRVDQFLVRLCCARHKLRLTANNHFYRFGFFLVT